MRFYYQVYGLFISSNAGIPGLNAERVEKCKADIKINLGFFPKDILRALTRPLVRYYLEPGHEKEAPPNLVVNTLADGQFFHFYYDGGAEFIIDKDATHAWGIWKAPLVLEDVALYLLGPIIGFMLRLRGTTCLHASGAVLNGQSFALTGPSGAGKSTLAASLAADGYSVLTDDILPLTIEKDEIYTHSGYSRLRLFPNSFENLQELPNSLPLLTPSWNKCYLDLASESFKLYKFPTILKVIYIIDWSMNNSVPLIESLEGASALTFLAANTYRNDLLSPEMRASEFVFLSQLLSRVKVKKLHTVNNISAVPQLRDLLLKDFRIETCGQNTSHLNLNKELC